jgi:hypothetical protein
MWNEFSTMIEKRVINTLFLGNKQIDVLSYEMDQDIDSKAIDRGEDTMVDWELTCTVRLRGKEFEPYLQYFEYESRESDVTFVFNSAIEVRVDHDPGDYWTPPYTDVDVFRIETEISESYVDGSSSAGDPELIELIKKTDAIIENFSDHELKELLTKNLRNQLILKKED